MACWPCCSGYASGGKTIPNFVVAAMTNLCFNDVVRINSSDMLPGGSSINKCFPRPDQHRKGGAFMLAFVTLAGTGLLPRSTPNDIEAPCRWAYPARGESRLRLKGLTTWKPATRSIRGSACRDTGVSVAGGDVQRDTRLRQVDIHRAVKVFSGLVHPSDEQGAVAAIEAKNGQKPLDSQGAVAPSGTPIRNKAFRDGLRCAVLVSTPSEVKS